MSAPINSPPQSPSASPSKLGRRKSSNKYQQRCDHEKENDATSAGTPRKSDSGSDMCDAPVKHQQHRADWIAPSLCRRAANSELSLTPSSFKHPALQELTPSKALAAELSALEGQDESYVAGFIHGLSHAHKQAMGVVQKQGALQARHGVRNALALRNSEDMTRSAERVNYSEHRACKCKAVRAV